MQTFWDVRIVDSPDKRIIGLWSNISPLRRDAAEKLASQERAAGHTVEILPTKNKLWEEVFGDKI